jgi:hypothetical protein
VTHDDIVSSVSALEVKTKELREQIKALKKIVDKPKTFGEKFKEYAGVVSLILGVVISIFTIRESVFTKPAAARDAKRVLLDTTLASLISVQQEFAKAQQEHAPPAVLSSIAERAGYIADSAERQTRGQGGLTSFEDEIALGEALEHKGDVSKAIAHYQSALTLASAPSDKARADTGSS